MVLISPLCASVRNGCASAQSAEVLVLKRWWNVMNGETKPLVGQVRDRTRSSASGVTSALWTTVRVDSETIVSRDAGGARDALDPQAGAIQRGVGGRPRLVEAGDHLQHLRRGVALRAQHRGAIGRDDAPVDGAGAGEPQLALDDLGGLQAVGRVHEQHAERRASAPPAGGRRTRRRPRSTESRSARRSRRRAPSDGVGAAVGQPAQRRQAVARRCRGRRGRGCGR